MPISYLIALYGLTGRMHFWSMTTMLWFCSKTSNKTNKPGFSVLISHKGCPGKMICETIPLYRLAVCKCGMLAHRGHDGPNMCIDADSRGLQPEWKIRT